MKKELIEHHKANQEAIKARLQDFKSLKEKDYFYEHLYCLLTPQSNAKKCWEAVEQLKKAMPKTQEEISNILKTKTRFHNNKSRYIIEATHNWDTTKKMLSNSNITELRNALAKQVKGYGLKEASHFLRNIGKSDNKIAILDRHILRNLVYLEIIESDKIKNDSHYIKLEKSYLNFAKELKIPADELDLALWSKENGEVFK